MGVLHHQRCVQIRVVGPHQFELLLGGEPTRKVTGGVEAPDPRRRQHREGDDDEDQDELRQALTDVAHAGTGLSPS